MTAIMPAPVTTLVDWTLCPQCQTLIYGKRFERSLYVCPECKRHSPLTAVQRLGQLLDPDSVQMLDVAAEPADHLGFADTLPYVQRLREAQSKTGLTEAVVCARGTIDGHAVVAAVMDFRFMGGSLSSAVGELITQTAEIALRERVPLLIVTASGGARMQEGALSLMQMAKTSQALRQLDEAGILTISLVTDPTYGGVAASYATLCDVIIAEPGARLGFAGPRVIRQTIQQTLPPGFQTAESLLLNGMVDTIQPRQMLRHALSELLATGKPQPPHKLPATADNLIRDPEQLPDEDAWKVVQRARRIDRPTTTQFIAHLIDGFFELHGDRAGGDCPAIVGGMGRFQGTPVVVIGHQKGSTTSEMMARNFGMATPSGYRKAARLMRLAAKLRLPIVTLIDTPGAYPGIEAEEHGQAVAIAENLRLMAGLPVPVVAVVTGEGGSGGALALGVANRVLLCANAIYSVISPEGCAAILWKTAAAAPTAAAALRLRAPDLLRSQIVDAVIPEPGGGAHEEPLRAAEMVRDALICTLNSLSGMTSDELIADRHARFRRYGANAVALQGGVYGAAPAHAN
jgi:acetyl-CoA carboxylase carboxyl transferase subunit beta